MYPVFFNLNRLPCIVIGAGMIAQRRIFTLLSEQADLTVIAPEPMPIALQNKPLRYLQTSYQKSLLQQARLVFAATSDSALNKQIVVDAQEQGLLASSVTGDANADFQVPAQVSSGTLTAAISTGGASPSLAAAICREIKPVLDGYAELCTVQQQLRIGWKTSIQSEWRRKQALSELSTPESLEYYRKYGAEAYRQHMDRNIKRAAILVVSYGTSYESTREKTIGAVEQAIQTTFPDCDVFRAFTSSAILQKMKQAGQFVYSVPEALTQLQELGYQTVYCQPTYITDGKEYDKFCTLVKPFQHLFTVCQIGYPLLYQTEDFSALLQAIAPAMPAREHTAYLLVGHGAMYTIPNMKNLEQNQTLLSFCDWLKQNGKYNVFVATMRGEPSLETVLKQLQGHFFQTVVLLPLMLTAGKHICEDILGEKETSWKQILKRNGYRVEGCSRGLGEWKAVQQLYVQHLNRIIQHFTKREEA